jgi:hypothetical protein
VCVTVKRLLDSDDKALHSKVYGDPWRSPKDGKQMVNPNSKWMRKWWRATSRFCELVAGERFGDYLTVELR